MIGVLALLVVYAGLVSLLLWAPRLRKRWMRITSRVLGAAGLVPLVVIILGIFFGLALNAGNPSAKTRVIKSSDGQEAKLSYSAGFLGRDYTEVTLKHTGCCRHIAVFSHSGPSWFDDPKLEWLDNHNLHISYHARPGDPQHCEDKVGEVIITCASSPWPDPHSADPASSDVPHK